MKSYLKSLDRFITWSLWQFLYVTLGLSWLLGPSLNPGPSGHTAFISQYEDPGQPWSWLYRLCDILAGLLLGVALFVIVRRKIALKRDSIEMKSVVLLGIFALGSIIDDVFPSTCDKGGVFCLVSDHALSLIHSVESVITALALLVLNVIWLRKNAPWAKFVLAIQAIWIAVFAVHQIMTQSSDTLVQFIYQIVVTLWVAQLVPLIMGRKKKPAATSRNQVIIHIIAAWIFLGGFVAIVSSVRNLSEISELSSAYFGNNTAWLSQHGVAVGVVLMYISRHLWRGEYRAWQLASLMLWLETIKYSVISPNSLLVLLYGITAAVLFASRETFDRLTSTEELRERLKKLAFVAGAALIALFVGVITLRFKHHQDVDSLKINAGQFTKHLFLFDVVNDLGPLSRRLLGQVLNVAGLTLLFAVLISLFRPNKPLLQPADSSDQQKLLDLLDKSSISSEDYFKYWPQPKNYWWNEAGTAVIAYCVTGNVAFALADPVAVKNSSRNQAMEAFSDYCRQNGWIACFLMVGANALPRYKKAGYKSFRIGASAVVDIDEFTTQTMRNKWWRWVLNKAKRQEWEYAYSEPPHSSETMSGIRHVSDTWLQRQGRVERGFALGYYDESYLQKCRLHLLRHGGDIIAFANELPAFNDLPTATIDLMRFLPEYKHIMPSLLAHTIHQLHNENHKRKFDLGFVPLASPPTARTEQLIKNLGQLLLGEAISARGLEQFKNKFSPEWENNYIAFDGDWVDLIHISRQLDSLLKV